MKKDGKPCAYQGKHERDGKHYCKTHLPIEDCSVCYDSITARTCVSLTCGHRYHSKCLRKWITTNHYTCPYCREQIPDDVIDRLRPTPAETTQAFVIDFQGNMDLNNSSDLQRFIMSILNMHILGIVTAAQAAALAPS